MAVCYLALKHDLDDTIHLYEQGKVIRACGDLPTFLSLFGLDRTSLYCSCTIGHLVN